MRQCKRALIHSANTVVQEHKSMQQKRTCPLLHQSAHIILQRHAMRCRVRTERGLCVSPMWHAFHTMLPQLIALLLINALPRPDEGLQVLRGKADQLKQLIPGCGKCVVDKQMNKGVRMEAS